MSQSVFASLQVDSTRICFVRLIDETIYRLTDGSSKAICGSVFRQKARMDQGIIIPRMRILMQPTPEELDVLLPWIGFIEGSTDVFTPTQDITDTPAALKLDRVATVDDLGNAYVDKAIFRGQKGTNPMSLELHVVMDAAPDIDGTTIDGSFPGTLTAPYPFHRGVLTAEAATRAFDSFAFIVNNRVQVQHNNSNVPTDFEYAGCSYHLGTGNPWDSDHTALLTNPIASAAGAAGSVVFTRGGQSTTFAFTNLKTEARPPSIPGKSDDPLASEIRLQQYYESFADGATAPVVITHDATA